ncbi:Ubiquinone biosynthesis O-methyltransferase [Methylococcales bacterium]|nr:Ubiquinone biosynthesis O-methyltransferase [Methylococcales bacterium]
MKSDNGSLDAADKTGQESKQTKATIDNTNDPAFVSYYEEQSRRPEVIKNFQRLKNLLLRFYTRHTGQLPSTKFTVLDVGCGTGTQAIIWAEDGHQVFGVDISENLVEIGKERMAKAGVEVDFRVGSSTQLPLLPEQIDICLLPEILEHVPDWQETIAECVRVLKPKGMIYISTSNALCPKQEEFTLPLYSWYPAFIKRICESKAKTTHRHWVNYATYPAVNWFTNPGLAKYLCNLGFQCFDRFDIMDLTNEPKWVVWLVNNIILRVRLARFGCYFLSGSTNVLAIKQ